jgi:hypothetical protein
MGPLTGLFGYLYDQATPERIAARRAKLSAGDDMGPIILDPEHPSPPEAFLPWKLREFDRKPGIKGSRPYREPTQAGPEPPASGPFTSVLGRR